MITVEQVKPDQWFRKWDGKICRLERRSFMSARIETITGDKSEVALGTEVLELLPDQTNRAKQTAEQRKAEIKAARSEQLRKHHEEQAWIRKENGKQQKTSDRADINKEDNMSKVETIRKLRESNAGKKIVKTETAKAEVKKNGNGKTNLVSKSGAVQLYGLAITAVLRWMGKNDFTAPQAYECLKVLKVPPLPFERTVENQLVAGRLGIKGDPARLTGEQIEELKGIAKTVKPVEKPVEKKADKKDGKPVNKKPVKKDSLRLGSSLAKTTSLKEEIAKQNAHYEKKAASFGKKEKKK